jgi:hypothetical protein
MRHRLLLVLVAVVVVGCGGSSSSSSSSAAKPPVTATATRSVTSWWDAERLRPQATGAVGLDPAGNPLRDAAGGELKVGEWVWYHDQDGSPVRRVERFAADGRSLGWTEYNADAVDPVSRRGSVRDDSSDGVQR